MPPLHRARWPLHPQNRCADNKMVPAWHHRFILPYREFFSACLIPAQFHGENPSAIGLGQRHKECAVRVQGHKKCLGMCPRAWRSHARSQANNGLCSARKRRLRTFPNRADPHGRRRRYRELRSNMDSAIPPPPRNAPPRIRCPISARRQCGPNGLAGARRATGGGDVHRPTTGAPRRHRMRGARGAAATVRPSQPEGCEQQEP